MSEKDAESKVDLLIRIAALQLIGDKTGSEAIGLLLRTGLSTELIADIVGTTPATVRVVKAREKSNATAPKKKSKRQVNKTPKS